MLIVGEVKLLAANFVEIVTYQVVDYEVQSMEVSTKGDMVLVSVIKADEMIDFDLNWTIDPLVFGFDITEDVENV